VSPENVGLLMKLATLATAARKNEIAIDAYKKILAINAENKLAANNLAALLMEGSQDEQDKKQALELVSKLKDSKHSAFLDTYGWVSFLNGNLDEAETALEAAIRKKDSTPEMHYHLAMVYLEKGDDTKAKRHLENAVGSQQKYAGLDKAKQALERLK
jgi:Tfp pilus assembly protein PilF